LEEKGKNGRKKRRKSVPAVISKKTAEDSQGYQRGETEKPANRILQKGHIRKRNKGEKVYESAVGAKLNGFSKITKMKNKKSKQENRRNHRILE